MKYCNLSIILIKIPGIPRSSERVQIFNVSASFYEILYEDVHSQSSNLLRYV